MSLFLRLVDKRPLREQWYFCKNCYLQLFSEHNGNYIELASRTLLTQIVTTSSEFMIYDNVFICGRFIMIYAKDIMLNSAKTCR